MARMVPELLPIIMFTTPLSSMSVKAMQGREMSSSMASCMHLVTGILGVRREEWVPRAYGVVVWGWVGLWLMWCCGGWWVIVMMVDVVWWLMGYCDDG